MQKETNSVYMLQKYHKILDSYGIKVKLFADDAKLYVKIVNSVDTAVLQAALNALCLWADKWQLIARSHMTIGMTTGLQTYANYLAAHWLTVYQWS